MMRRILVDHAKSHNRNKRGGGALKVSLMKSSPVSERPPMILLSSIEALNDWPLSTAKKPRCGAEVLRGVERRRNRRGSSGFRDYRCTRLEAGKGLALHPHQ